jgi:hypothetical protein
MGYLIPRAEPADRSRPAPLRHGRGRVVLWAVLGASVFAGCSSTDSTEAARDFEAMGRGYTVASEMDLHFRQGLLMRRPLAKRDFLKGVDGQPNPASDEAPWHSDLISEFANDFDWIAPQRILDDLAQEDLRGPQTWKLRSAAYQASGSARDAYLLGRLEVGERGVALLAKSQQLDPQLSWGRHGHAWTQTRSGRPERGVAMGERAIELAASLAETIYFERAAAVGEVAAGQRAKAEQRLLSLSEHPGLLPAERAELQAWALGSRLRNVSITMDDLVSGSSGSTGDAYGPALALLREGSGLSGIALEQLARDIAGASFVGRTGAERLRAVLGELEGRADTTELAKQLRHELYLRELGGAIGSLGDGTGPLDAEQLQAAIALVGGDAQPWIDAWWKRLPVFLQDAYGESLVSAQTGFPPGSAATAAIFKPMRGQINVPGPLTSLLTITDRSEWSTPGGRVHLAKAFVDAGWYTVAEALLLGDDSDAEQVAALRTAATRSRGFLTELRYLADEAIAEDSEFSLEDVLGQLDGLAQSHGLVGDKHLPLTESARLHYGPFAEVVHPGPRYLGSGPRPEGTVEGAQVPGLAKLLASLGRMGIFGAQLGNPDIVVRPVLGWQWIEGRHLGAPFEGTVFWCQGVDIPSRFERLGAGIAGAALHEGYWIDIESVRGNWQGWQTLRERFYREQTADREAVVYPIEPAPKCTISGRTQKVPLLGEAQRLAVRMFADRAGNPVQFDEFLRAVAIHEEGHLCDRQRFVPFGDHLLETLQFLAECNFSPLGVMKRLEYRAQLVALCETADPRIVLFDILSQVEELEARLGTDGVTPHAAAYGDLLRDLVAMLDTQLAENPDQVQSLSRNRYLRWQLHGIDPEQLRWASLRLADEQGLVQKAE